MTTTTVPRPGSIHEHANGWIPGEPARYIGHLTTGQVREVLSWMVTNSFVTSEPPWRMVALLPASLKEHIMSIICGKCTS